MTKEFPPKRYMATATVKVVANLNPHMLPVHVLRVIDEALRKQFGADNICVEVAAPAKEV